MQIRRSVHRAHPAIRPGASTSPGLLAAPIRFRRDPAARKASRITIANAFQAKKIVAFKEQSPCCKGISADSQRHDDIWKPIQRRNPGGG